MNLEEAVARHAASIQSARASGWGALRLSTSGAHEQIVVVAPRGAEAIAEFEVNGVEFEVTDALELTGGEGYLAFGADFSVSTVRVFRSDEFRAQLPGLPPLDVHVSVVDI